MESKIEEGRRPVMVQLLLPVQVQHTIVDFARRLRVTIIFSSFLKNVGMWYFYFSTTLVVWDNTSRLFRYRVHQVVPASHTQRSIGGKSLALSNNETLLSANVLNDF
jgi:hypothetical protein